MKIQNTSPQNSSPPQLAATHFPTFSPMTPIAGPLTHPDSAIGFLPFQLGFHFQVMLVAVIGEQECQWLTVREVIACSLKIQISCFYLADGSPPITGLRIQALSILWSHHPQQVVSRLTPKVEWTQLAAREMLVGLAWMWYAAELRVSSGVSSRKRTQIWCTTT